MTNQRVNKDIMKPLLHQRIIGYFSLYTIHVFPMLFSIIWALAAIINNFSEQTSDTFIYYSSYVIFLSVSFGFLSSGLFESHKKSITILVSIINSFVALIIILFYFNILKVSNISFSYKSASTAIFIIYVIYFLTKVKP